jgi:SAM-dependent methyltransferase
LLTKLGKFKRGIVVTPEDLRQIDEALVARWQIDFISTPATLLEYMEALPEGETRTRGLAAFKADVATRGGSSGEQNMYEAMADPQLCGLVTSSRRHYLLDAVAMAIALYRTLGLTGPILDVGCHVGVAPDLMAEILGVPVVGLEPVDAAVRIGSERLSGRPDVSIVHGAIPWQTDSKFQLITAIDSMPGNVGDRSVYLRGLSQVLDAGGIALIVSATWVQADVIVLRRQLEAAGLGFGFADVVGGYGGMPTAFNVEGCVCLIKGGKQPFPRKIGEVMESEWDRFKAYANSTTTPAREKTQAFMRSALQAKASAVEPHPPAASRPAL